MARMIWVIAFLWALFNLYCAAFGAFHNMLQGSIALIFAYILCFYKYPLFKADKYVKLNTGINVTFAILGLIATIYVIVNSNRFLQNPIAESPGDLILALVMLVLILEGARRTLGPVMPIISLALILYALLGPVLPMPWAHMGFRFPQILQHLYINLAGFWGTITDVVVTVIPIYIILGAVIFATGGGNAFIGVGSLVGGRTEGGAAKIAIISSALFGMISGSSVANVATTGSMTIPMMKKLGYRPSLAGAVEATASTGGQIMPPIMGAGAFIMAELLSIPYVAVIKAAIIPAVLYFLSAFMGIHFEAKRIKLGKPPKELISSLNIVSLFSFLVPLAVLIILLVLNYTPMYAAFWAVVSSAIFYLLAGGKLNSIWKRLKVLADGLVSSSYSLLSIVFIGFCAQVTVSIIGLTGVGIKFSDLIVSLGGSSLLLTLILTAVITLVLGMGVPTTAAYLIAASVVGPALISLQLLPIGAHMFIFYFAVIASITPPVCAAVYVAAGIAESNWLRTGIDACKLAIAAFVVPFMFVYSPVLLMEGKSLEIILAVLTSVVGVILLSGGVIGYLVAPLNIIGRLFLIGASLCLIKPGLFTDIIGIGLAVVIILFQVAAKRRGARGKTL